MTLWDSHLKILSLLRRFCFPFIILAYPACAAFAAESRCEAISEHPDVPYGGHVLRTIPDILNPELRTIDAIIDVRGCLPQATKRLIAYKTLHPQDYMAASAEARIAWVSGQPQEAGRILAAALVQHPDFHSAKTLSAGLAIARFDKSRADALLQEVLTAYPNDLWGVIDRLRVDAMPFPSDKVANSLLTIVQDANFPPNARETAVEALLQTSNRQTGMQVEEAVKVNLSFESMTPQWGKILLAGSYLIEFRGKYRDGRALLSSLLDQPKHTEGEVRASELAAESYLLEAAQIDPTPSPKNADLLQKAKSVMVGDLSELGPRAAANPNLRPILPFLKGIANPNVVDEKGNSMLCNAVEGIDMEKNRQLVQTALDAGANPNTPCEMTTPLGLLLMTGVRNAQNLPERLAALKILLDHGADPNPRILYSDAFAYCKDIEICEEKVLPLLQSYPQTKK